MSPTTTPPTGAAWPSGSWRSARRRSSSPAATAPRPWTGSSTVSGTCRSRSSATARRRRTAPAARTRRAWPPSSREARASRMPPAAPQRSPPRQCETASPISAAARARSTSSILRLSELGEFGLLAELERRGLVRGQDAEGAVLADGVVVTQDVLVEGIHFRPDWISWSDLGYKAAAVNLSDLAALAAEPEALLVSLALPPETKVDDVVELYEGLAEPGVPIAGGDTTRAERLTLTVTAVGHSERVPGRAGAVPGDVLVVTGPLGGAAAGLHALREGLEGFPE